MINKELVKSRFEKSIETYDKTAIVQRSMAEILSENICKYCGTYFENIFEFGTGTGFLTTCISKKIQFKDYTANDIVDKSQKFVNNIIPNAKFINGDIETIKLEQQFDLIVSNASMQWVSDLEKLLRNLKLSLKKNGTLAFTTFGEQNYREIKDTTGLTLNYLKTETLIQLLENYFNIVNLEENTQTILFENPMDVLKHIKDTGTNGIQKISWTVKKLKDFEKFYSLKYSEKEKVKLTYNPIYIILKHK